MLHEGEVDLNDLIKKEKTEAKKKHMIQKQKKENPRKTEHRRPPIHKPSEKMFTDAKHRVHPGYAVLVKGFISDVSVDDIFVTGSPMVEFGTRP